MYFLDFFNSPPQYSIFKKEKNKTQFGGVLFMIYIIIMLIISLIYILDYAINDKYEIESFVIDSLFNTKSYYDKTYMNFDQNINPETEYRFQVSMIYDVSLEEHTININDIIDNLFIKKDNIIYKGTFCNNKKCQSNSDNSYMNFDITQKVYDNGTPYALYLRCNDSDCTNYDENIFDSLSVMTKDFNIHLNLSEPFEIINCFDNYDVTNICKNVLSNKFTLDESTPIKMDLKLSTIVYEEKKGISRLLDYLLNKPNNKSIAYIEGEQSEISEDYDNEFYKTNILEGNDYEGQTVLYRRFASVYTSPMSKYQKYRRSEIGFLTVLANIGALFSTFNVVFILFFSFYSKNYDNYKIVEKILQTELNKGEINQRQIKLNDNKKPKMELSEIDLNKDKMDSPLMTKLQEIENIDDDTIKKKDKDIIDSGGKVRVLPRLSFFEFFFNNVYFAKCKRRKNQEILDLCNSIILNYSSIDSMIVSLLKLENLFEDYKWNNPSLNDITKNKLISDLVNNYIEN